MIQNLRQFASATILLLVILSFPGCASIFHGPDFSKVSTKEGQQVKVKLVSPFGYEVETVAPLYVYASAHRYGNIKIEVIDPCYEPQSIEIMEKIHYLIFFNYVNWVGWALDFLSGKAWVLDSEVLLVPKRKAQECGEFVAEEGQNEIFRAVDFIDFNGFQSLLSQPDQGGKKTGHSRGFCSDEAIIMMILKEIPQVTIEERCGSRGLDQPQPNQNTEPES